MANQEGKDAPPFFNGRRDEYQKWRVKFRAFMRLKQIDTEDDKLSAKHKQRLADYLILSVDDTNFTLLQGVDEKEGIEMWKTLQNKYASSSVIEKRMRRDQLRQTRFLGHAHMDEYIATKVQLMSEIERAGDKFTAEQRVTELIVNLPPEYDTVIDNITLLGTFDDQAVSKCVALLTSRAMVLSYRETTQTGAHAVSTGGGGRGVRGGGRGNAKGRGPVKCHNCGEMGHIVRVCPNRVCYKCQKKGHIARECRSGTVQAREAMIDSSQHEEITPKEGGEHR